VTIKVFVHNGPLQGQSFDINEDLASIGRGSENNIQIDEPSVSKRHALLLKAGDDYFIQDLKSQNGTWINGSIIRPGTKVALESGTAIALGNVLVSAGKRHRAQTTPVQYSIDLSACLDESACESVFADTLMTNRRKLHQINEITNSLVSLLNIKEVYQKIMDSLFLAFKKVNAGAILLRDEASGELSQVITRFREPANGSGLYVSQSIVRQALEKPRAIMIPDIRQSKEDDLSRNSEINRIVSVICVPLIAKAGLLGVIYAYSANEAQGFQKEDLSFITSISNPAAVAIENALLYEKTKQSEAALIKAREELEIRVQERTADLQDANRKLTELSITDDLTGLFNRRYFINALESEYVRSVRYKRSLSVLLLDLDNFKDVNDLCGHSCGDDVLKKVSSMIREMLRSSDILARYGGDEIVILLPEANKNMAAETAEKLRAQVEQQFFTWKGRSFNVTCSVGIASVPEDKVRDWGGLLDKADRALYMGKAEGRNIVIAFDSDGRTPVLVKPQVAPDLQKSRVCSY
jgi:diguanylate cyclase (GGDEF)-like protein